MGRKNLEGERFLMIYFCTLLRRILKESETLRDGIKIREIIDQKILSLAAHIQESGNPPNPAQLICELFGFRDGYPYGYATSAPGLGLLTPEAVMSLERTILGNISAIAGEQIARIKLVWLKNNPCPSCATVVGKMHGVECEKEECPFCHGLLWGCDCAYKHLNLGRWGRSRAEWRALEKERQQRQPHAGPIDKKAHARPLTNEEKRLWIAIVNKKGCIRYGQEQRFQ